MHIAVVGCGLIGSAAAKYLAKAGYRVTLIGPDESDGSTGRIAAPGSHWDEGRITRKLATVPFWSEVARASIERYAEIERESDVRFFSPAGAMMAAPADSTFMADVTAVHHTMPGVGEPLGESALKARFPYFRFPEGFTGIYEATNAGHISPRRLVAAQTRIAMAHGARRIAEPLRGLDERAAAITLHTTTQTIHADHAVIATGGMSDHVLPDPLGLKVYARTVAFFEVSEAMAVELAKMPSLVFRIDATWDPYLLPPIRYPDGRLYLKLGGDPTDRPLTSRAEIEAWYATDGSGEVRAYLTDRMRTLMPGLRIEEVSSAACMTTFSESGLPIIDRLSPRLTVATAGNGAGAKCSDELGRLGAELAQGGDPVPALRQRRSVCSEAVKHA